MEQLEADYDYIQLMCSVKQQTWTGSYQKFSSDAVKDRSYFLRIDGRCFNIMVTVANTSSMPWLAVINPLIVSFILRLNALW